MDIDIEPPHPEATEPLASFLPPPTKSGRIRQFPSRYQDFLPNSRTQVPHLPAVPEPSFRVPPSPLPFMSPTTSPEPEEPGLQHLQTEPDDFGLFRIYPIRPTIEPDTNSDLDDVCDAPGLETFETPSSRRWWARFGSTDMTTNKKISNNIYAPFKNPTIFRLINWYHSSSGEMSISRLNSLVKDVINPSDFQKEHFDNFSAKRELQRLDDEEDTSYPFSNENVWKVSTVTIPLPAEHVKHTSEIDAPVLEVPGVHHRNLVEAITTAFQDETAKKFHYTPHHLYWKPTPESEPERVITDLFNADAFISEYKELLKLSPPSSATHMEMAIAAMMVWSDSTHLAEFGTASLWPIYLFFGNQSKYSRARPSDFAAHHIAYIPSVCILSFNFGYLIYFLKLPEDFQDTYMKEFDGLAASATTITHLKCELVQKVWELLLDHEFMAAYELGIVITCADGVTRQIYPRFFTYSADYPEKCVAM
jgi:Plavaka transposase